MVNCCRSLGRNRRPGEPGRSSSRSASPEMKFARHALSDVHVLSTLLPEVAGGLTRSSQARPLTSSRSPHAKNAGASGQYDDLARVPRAEPRQSRGRRSFAPRPWCRATPRRSRGMEPTVRNPRIESTIGPTPRGARNCVYSTPEHRLVSCHPKFSRQERNFWMQRPEGKNPPERPLLSAETGNVENGRQESPRKGLFSIDDGFRSSGRLGGGVRSHMRTRLPCFHPVFPCS